jgi:outer membrane protein assembly factor BamA
MAQQTAVEWYIDELFKLQVKYLHSDLTSVAYNDLKKQLKEQAKEMFKQQILAAFEEGAMDGYYGEGSYNKEKYYTQAYNK